ncbi:FAS1-like dehydratase domain-containing protein [Pseudonocardia oroxyli]|uniref:3-methylfumaryl-CoA hydratase n=1 Tax=Pseudonocardia oroxyli TaxID=366584 RepID=A0A1G8DUD2_PSEOR|nr:MaoC family dehydratase N-terminal domain-containing protein [Pseudonocardia oroxyli]SDH61215.1 3-methylfumaryl-CoA hydratase [Pseudonocardia oroxyli]
MTDLATQGSLAAAVADWHPPTVELTRRVDPWPAAAFADLVETDPPALDDGAPLPPLWHWFLVLAHPRTSEIGEDGHPADGPFLPPIPGRRRMIAGGRFTRHRPIPFGSVLTSRSAVSAVVPRSGRTGEMLFVTVRSELTVDGDPAVAAVEEQDVVYRSEPEGTERRTMARPEGGRPEPAAAWRLRLPTDSVLLSRFSALTYNGHRIHHDVPYVTAVEGYPDLVIHGPLMALLALELPRRHAPQEQVESVSYRLSRPAFVPSPLVATGDREGDTATVAVAAEGVEPSLTAQVRLR